MKRINWNAEKNQLLMSERGISFEDVVHALLTGKLLDNLAHPNDAMYPNQGIFVVEADEYAWLVPYVENENEILLKSVIPSRKITQHYLKGPYE